MKLYRNAHDLQVILNVVLNVVMLILKSFLIKMFHVKHFKL